MQNSKKSKFRHELKFLISTSERDIIKQRLQTVLSLDANAENGSYMIRSLYFDDMWETAYSEKLMGTNTRRKYRIRCYNASDKVIKLECKKKEGQYISKTAARLTREETDSILRGDVDFLKDRKEKVCRDFYVEWKANLMRPKVIVDYDREPFVYPFGDVRITFDNFIRAGVSDFNLFNPELPVLEIMEQGQLIMEVKFTEYLPNIIRDLLRIENCVAVAASKYVMCVEKSKEYTMH
ncbi:MAG: polyphosphate polymerase domain-containing protein [Lachnospiraceae bacterium]|nr:polyphosphate polymerase domain-containing protein [Lachnospiraceae bacterium]